MSGFSLVDAATALANLLTTKAGPEVDAVFADLETRFPDAKPVIEGLRAAADGLVNLPALAEAAPAAFADALATIKAGSGPVDTSGGLTG